MPKTDDNVLTQEDAAFVPYVGEDPVRFRTQVTTIGDTLLDAWDRYPNKSAVIFPDTDWSYNELVQRAMHTARGLKALGVKPGEHVGLLMPNSPELIQMFFAVAFCGAVSVMVNARYRSSELAYVVENADLVTLLTSDAAAEHVDFVERINGAFPDLADNADPMRLNIAAAPRLRNIALMGTSSPAGFVDEAAFRRAAESVSELDVHRTRVRVRVRETGLILYTSGTTANPKGCLISHEAMVRNASVLGRHRLRLTADDTIWSPLPVFHIAAMLAMLSIYSVGGTFVGMQHFEPGLSLKMIEEHKATMLFSPFVTFQQALLHHPDFAKTDLSAVRLMNSCFAVQPKEVGDAFRKATPQTLQLGTFGMTETCGFVTTGHWGMDPELGFTRLGTPLIGQEVRIVSPETGEDLPVGEHGEVLVRGYNLMDGYYRDADKTAETLDAEGWYHSGDIGSVDENGHIMFHGRLKDMLKVGGENVAAVEIESLLEQHAAVKLAQVVGIPDEKYEEVPAAFIELKPGCEAGEDELIEFCRERIAGFKVPRAVRFVTEWPMSTSKIQKFQLRDALLEELGLA